ncbi:MAG TPA: hypothetical protein VGD37_29835 [Kofleriaceae bacterium]|jgi:RNA polymerase sigma factor (sigma-70 family)
MSESFHDPGLTRDAWNRFLHALAPDAALAASRYEQLRHRLIARYRWRGLPCPEDLADQVFDQVADRLVRGHTAEPDLTAYLAAVARRIARQARRSSRGVQPLDRIAAPELRVPAPAPHEPDDPLARLCRCLDQLPPRERQTLLAYEAGPPDEHVRRRKALAAELGIPINALRVRVHRLRARVSAMMRGDPPATDARRRAV